MLRPTTYVSETLPAAQVAAALAGAGFEVGPFRPVHRTLLDTFDGRLHAADIRLEARKAGDGRTTLVVGDGASAAVEVSVAAIPSRAGDLPPGPVRTRLAPVLDVRALLPAVTVATREAVAVRRNDAGKVVAAVVLSDPPALPVASAFELRPYEGYERATRQTASFLGSLRLTRRDGDLLDLAAADAGVDLRGFVDSPTVALDVVEPALEGFRRVLANLAATIETNRQGTVDDIDPEFLHDFRVAVRRTRSVLSHGKRVVPAEARDHFGAEFRWLGTVTSPPRDLDVYVIEWPGYVAALDAGAVAALEPIASHVARQRDAAHVALTADLAGGRYRGLMTAWRSWLDAPLSEPDAAKSSASPLGPVVAKRLSDAQTRLLGRGRAIGPDTAAEELHELRKDAKRLRYLLECFGGLLPASVRKPFVQRLKALQDNLGEHQDTEVHSGFMKALSTEIHGQPGVTAETLLAMGRLIELFERRRQAARDTFADRFAAYDSKPTAKALADLMDAANGR